LHTLNVNVFEALFAFGVTDVNVCDMSIRRTPLADVVASKRLDCARLLLAMGADASTTDYFGRSVATSKNDDVRRLLFEHSQLSVRTQIQTHQRFVWPPTF
jgi:hypothetical protein